MSHYKLPYTPVTFQPTDVNGFNHFVVGWVKRSRSVVVTDQKSVDRTPTAKSAEGTVRKCYAYFDLVPEVKLPEVQAFCQKLPETGGFTDEQMENVYVPMTRNFVSAWFYLDYPENPDERHWRLELRDTSVKVDFDPELLFGSAADVIVGVSVGSSDNGTWTLKGVRPLTTEEIRSFAALTPAEQLDIKHRILGPTV